MKIIDELLDRIGIDKIYNYIEQSMLFYVSPTRYYLNLYSRERQEQYLQILLLLGMLSLCVLLFSEQIQLKEITRVVVIDLIITIFSFLPLAIAVRVVKKICHQPFDLSNVFVFVITSKYQLVPMLVIPLILYRKLENYSFYFIGVLIFWFMLFFIFIFSGRVFFSRIRYMALNFILAFIFFNVSLILIDLINIDSRPVYTGSLIIDDPIKNELFLQTKKMVSLSKVPTSKIVRESEGDKLGFYLFYNFGDSLYRGNFNETQNYIHDVDSNIILIRDSILPNIKFTRVKEIFKSYEDYYLSLRFELRTYPVTLDTAGLLEHHTEIVKGFVFNDYVYKPDTLLLSKRRAIVSKQLEIYDLSYRVTKLYELGAMIFLYPYYLYTLVIE